MNLSEYFKTNPLVLAPLAEITDSPFRRICRQLDAGIVFSGMLTGNGMVFRHQKTLKELRFDPEEHPLAVQIFGKDPDKMAEAARIVEAAGADIIDFNAACWVRKILKSQSGGGLLRTPLLLGEILDKMVKAVKIPVTVKIRKGFTENDRLGLEAAKIAQECGAAALSIHPRTVSQGFTGLPDHQFAFQLAEVISIPLIGSGEFTTPEKIREGLTAYPYRAVMLGRPVLGNPWLFKTAGHYLKTGELIPEPDFREKLPVINRHLELIREYYPERPALTKTKKHLCWYLKNLPLAAVYRNQINLAPDLKTVERILAGFTRNL